MTASLAIIVPILNEAANMTSLMAHLDSFHDRGAEIIIVDGGSTDDGPAKIHNRFTLIQSEPGRARQMNAGAKITHAKHLLFLHADTRLPEQADHWVAQALSAQLWGRFDVRISGKHRLLPMVALMMNWRSRLTGIATGDQAMFMRRSLFEQLGGFPKQPLMEDIAFSKRLKAIDKPACLPYKVTTAGRRWDGNGLWRTIFLMWWLRLAYWLGIDASTLARWYR